MREKLEIIEDLQAEICVPLKKAKVELEFLKEKIKKTEDEIWNVEYILLLAIDRVDDIQKVLQNAQGRAQAEFEKNMNEMEKNESTRFEKSIRGEMK